MERQTFSRLRLEPLLRKSDFRGLLAAQQAPYRAALLADAEAAAASRFFEPVNPYAFFWLSGKQVFILPDHSHRLVERKIACNLKQAGSVKATDRLRIVQRIALLLEEGVPFRAYRLDIKSFFESVPLEVTLAAVRSLRTLSPWTQELVGVLLRQHKALGGTGIPRGLPTSSCLAELVMHSFDEAVTELPHVYFYSRYVDDIIVITSGMEGISSFKSKLIDLLPNGLELNAGKFSVAEILEKSKELPSSQPSSPLTKFSFLGYEFCVRNPRRSENMAGARVVTVDMAPGKADRCKKRLCRTFLAYHRNGDWPLLVDRLKFLSSNYSVRNPRMGGERIAGIYASYPLITAPSKRLADLDRYLRHLIFGRGARAVSGPPSLSGEQRRALLALSFSRGFSKRVYVNFSPARMAQIQACWVH